MGQEAHFRVDPRLAALLGENYRSTEQALKELIDNAWDADARNVWIDLPEVVSDKPIVIRDDGSGMTESEIRAEYLNVASDRRTRRGDKTPKDRAVKGRKGIGKFAGLVPANVMLVTTFAHGKQTSVRIVKDDLLKATIDMERVVLPLVVEACDPLQHGTTLTLSKLNYKLNYPSSDAMKELLVLEYGREQDFTIFVNGETLAHEDIPGEAFTMEVDLPHAGKVKLRLTIMESPTTKRRAGLVMRVGGKVIGKPSLMGLDERDDIPAKMLQRVVGEVEVDSLDGDVTADGAAIIENSVALKEAREWVQSQLGIRVEESFKSTINVAKARRQKEINQRLAQMPENRRQFAQAALDKAMRRFYGEAPERIDVLISLVLDAFEKDEYWLVCQEIEKAKHSDVVAFAEALEKYGLLDMALMVQQAHRRLSIIDELEALAAKSETTEATMHRAIESNLWLFGAEYVEFSLVASNVSTAKIIREYLDKEFTGSRASKRPDLFLVQSVAQRALLVEFKRPSHTIIRDDENQAEKYRDDLTQHFGSIEILVIGGTVDSKMSSLYQQPTIRHRTYMGLFATARTQLNWLIRELGQ